MLPKISSKPEQVRNKIAFQGTKNKVAQIYNKTAIPNAKYNNERINFLNNHILKRTIAGQFNCIMEKFAKKFLKFFIR